MSFIMFFMWVHVVIVYFMILYGGSVYGLFSYLLYEYLFTYTQVSQVCMDIWLLYKSHCPISHMSFLGIFFFEVHFLI